MDSSSVLAKSFLAVSLASAVAVATLFNIAAAGLPARLLVHAFLAGLLTSAIAAALSFRRGSASVLHRICRAVFCAYAFAATSIVLWVVVAKPPFG